MSIKMSPDITAFSAALLAFQAEATGVVKDSKNPHFKNRYASLEAVVEEARPVLQRVGISWMQAPGAITAGNIGMTTLLMHAASGQWVMSDMDIPLGKQDPQGAGSAITYAQRYSLMASLGLPPVDDDAESAMPRQPQSAPMNGRNAPPANGSTSNAGGAPLSKVEMVAKIKTFDLMSDLIAWANSDAVHGAYGRLSAGDKAGVDAAYNAQQVQIEGPQAQAAE